MRERFTAGIIIEVGHYGSNGFVAFDSGLLVLRDNGAARSWDAKVGHVDASGYGRAWDRAWSSWNFFIILFRRELAEDLGVVAISMLIALTA